MVYEMTGIYIERTSTVLSSKDIDLKFSRDETDAIKKMWNLLGIVITSGFAGSNSQVNKSIIPKRKQKNDLSHYFIPKVAMLSVMNMNSGCSRVNDESAEELVFRLKSTLLHHILLQDGYQDNLYHNNFEDAKVDNTLFDHLPEFLSLITNIIYDLENIHNSSSGLLGMGKICSRIWNFDVSHYNLIGEALVLTILEQIGRDKFSPEAEHLWLRFYNKLSQLLQSESEDPTFDLPILNDTPRSRFPSDTVTLSTISPRSSLNFPDDDIYSVRKLPSVDQDLDAFNLLNGIDEEDEDDSYDLINVFGYDQPETKRPSKKGYKPSLKRFTSRNRLQV